MAAALLILCDRDTVDHRVVVVCFEHQHADQLFGRA